MAAFLIYEFVASATLALCPAASAVNVRVGFVEQVATLAGRPLASVSLCDHPSGVPNAYAALQVDASRDGFKVRGVHAATHTAQVIEVQAFWDRANKLLIGQPVRESWFRVSVNPDAQPRVTLLVQTSEPKPAAAGGLHRHFRKDSIFDRLRDSHASSIAAWPVYGMGQKYQECV